MHLFIGKTFLLLGYDVPTDNSGSSEDLARQLEDSLDDLQVPNKPLFWYKQNQELPFFAAMVPRVTPTLRGDWDSLLNCLGLEHCLIVSASQQVVVYNPQLPMIKAGQLRVVSEPQAEQSGSYLQDLIANTFLIIA